MRRWEKVWRAAQWAQLGDPQNFYHELTVRRPFTNRSAVSELTFH
jgi:hypothetical protein